MDFLLGKRVVLTGAGSGMGLALVKKLLKVEEIQLIAVDLHTDALQQYKNKITIVQLDIGTKENIDYLFELAHEKLGGIDIFIANAGFAYYEKIREPNWRRIETIFAVNVFSPIYSLEKMVELCGDRRFSFVTTASAIGKLAVPGYSIYTGTKAAFDGFIHGYAYEKPSNAHIMTVYPISTRTGFFARSGENTPVAFPVQKPETVANVVIKGLQKRKKYVFPSKLFQTILVLNRFLLFILPCYIYFENRKFKKWLKKRETPSIVDDQKLPLKN